MTAERCANSLRSRAPLYSLPGAGTRSSSNSLVSGQSKCVIGGIAFRIMVIQAPHADGGGTSIHLPTYNNTNGTSMAAVDLPAALSEAMGAAVLAFMIEEGVPRRRSGKPAAANPIPTSSSA